ncbi:MAG: bifunctional 4-hydroxy-2-oxoglutarate aldolase/2-dehydro-3-deoxy-phosphogluconate aldolase [Trueperaceae bacterium]
MTSRSEATSLRIQDSGVIAILRGDFERSELLELTEAIINGGIRALELTLNSRDALDGITALRSHLGSDVLVGAGTVRNRTDASNALAAGSEFLVSPNLDLDTVRLAQEADILHLPGVFTPTEAQAALNAGCRLLKLFPCDIVGPAHLKALRGPLSDALFIPTGGVSPDTASEFLKAGAAALGLGGELTRFRDELDRVTEVAGSVVRAVQESRA